MPKYWGKQIFSHGSFPEVGEKQKKKVGKNNGQLRFIPPPPPRITLYDIDIAPDHFLKNTFSTV